MSIPIHRKVALPQYVHTNQGGEMLTSTQAETKTCVKNIW